MATPANAATTCVGGTLTAAAATGTISYTGGTVPAGGSCTLSVDVTSDDPGVFVNTTGDPVFDGTSPFTVTASAWGDDELLVTVDPADAVPECDEADNALSMGAWPCEG